LLGRLDDVRAHPLEVQFVDDRALRDYRHQMRDAELNRFLDQPVDPPLLDRREGKPQIGDGFLRPCRLDHGKRHALSPRFANFGEPFARRAVEQQELVPRPHPQNIGEVVRLRPLDGHQAAGGEGCVDE